MAATPIPSPASGTNRVVEVPAFATPKSTTGTWTVASGNGYPGAFSINGSPAIGHAIAFWDKFVQAGTYTVDIIGSRFTDGGIADLTIDGVAQSLSFDFYNASLSHGRLSATDVVIGSSGAKSVGIVVTGKNASSSSYTIRLHTIILNRTA